MSDIITSSPTIIVPQTKKQISQRKLEGYLKWAEVVQWGRMYPTKFVERFLGIELLDYQKYVFMMSWSAAFVLWCMGRNSGKTTLGSPFIMTKSLLIPNFEAYILAGAGSQSQEMFMKIEKIAKREIASFTGLTDVFFNETVKSAANKDGFTHNPSSFKYALFNGSVVRSLNGSFDNNRSKRSNLNFYDESGFAPDELFTTSEPFTTQNSDFRLGGDVDVSLFPRQFPNQLIYASSASSVDTYFYRKYKDFSKKMFLGDKRYFVADISSDVVMNATFNGKLYPVALLTQDKIDAAMRENREKAMREYKNIFTTEGGEKQPIRRAEIIKNSFVRPPMLFNENNEDRRIVLAYDPARSYDNSIIGSGEIFEDKEVGLKLRIQNIVSLVDIGKKKKTPMRTPEQIEYLKQMILDYNGKGYADYENIEKILIDSGAGGAGVNIGDYLMEDWTSKDGQKHRGLIDKVNSEEYVNKFPNALDKVLLVSPKKYRTEMFDALIEMLNLGLIEFTETYDMKGFIMIPKNIENEYVDDKKNIKKEIEVDYIKKILTFEEELALKNIDLAKEEMVQTYRFDGTNGAYRYDLPEDKKRTMHDDRAYVMAMLAWRLRELRRQHITNKQKPKSNILDFCM